MCSYTRDYDTVAVIAIKALCSRTAPVERYAPDMDFAVRICLPNFFLSASCSERQEGPSKATPEQIEFFRKEILGIDPGPKAEPGKPGESPDNPLYVRPVGLAVNFRPLFPPGGQGPAVEGMATPGDGD
jgi:hypothetical protein